MINEVDDRHKFDRKRAYDTLTSYSTYTFHMLIVPSTYVWVDEKCNLWLMT